MIPKKAGATKLINGLRDWQKSDDLWVQRNSAVETYLRFAKSQEGLNHWTETCGPNDVVNILDAKGDVPEIKMPGGGTIRPSDALWCFLNLPTEAGRAMWKKLVPRVEPFSIPGNRLLALYPWAIKSVFGVDSLYQKDMVLEAVGQMTWSGHGVMILTRDPGHFIGAVAFDNSTNELICRDSFPEGRPDGNGLTRRLGKDEFAKNVIPEFVII